MYSIKEKCLLLKILDTFLFIFVLFIFIYSIFASHTSSVHTLQKDVCCFSLIARVFFFASMEEFLYRVYFPEKLLSYFSFTKHYKKNNKRVETVIFLLSCTLFAFAHLYLGFFNVIFAFLVALFLNKTYICAKTKWNKLIAFILISAIHSLYNLFAFLIII